MLTLTTMVWPSANTGLEFVPIQTRNQVGLTNTGTHAPRRAPMSGSAVKPVNCTACTALGVLSNSELSGH